MSAEDRPEKERIIGSLGYILIKGDLGKEVIGNDPSVIPNDPRAEKKVKRWLAARSYKAIVT